MIPLTLALLLAAPLQEPELAPDGSPATTLVAYGVGDLTGAADIGMPPFGELEPGRQLEFIGTGWVEAWREHAERVADAEARAESLANEIRDYVAPPIAPEDVHVITPGVIAVAGATAQHAALARFLEWQRAASESVLVEAEVLKTAPGALTELGFGSQFLLSPEGREPLLERLVAGGAERITAPRILLDPVSSEGSIFVGEQVAYIRDFETEHDPRTRTTIADPIVDVVDDGLTLVVRITPLAGDSLGASVELRLTDVTRPIPTREIELTPNAAPVTIQEPDIRTTTVRTRVSAPSGHTAVLLAPDPDGQGDLVLLLTLSRAPVETGRRR